MPFRNSPPGRATHTPERCGSFACLHALSHACQRAAGIASDPAAVLDAARIAAAFRELPAAASEVEELAVERLLTRFSDELVRHLHARVHGHAPRVACGFAPHRYRLELEPGACRLSGTVEPCITEWLRRLLTALRATRPRSVATRATRRLQGGAASPTVSDLAAELGCSPAIVRRYFTRECGEPLSRFRIRARVLRAIELLRGTDWKIEAIAQEVGWRSKKDLYVQLKRATGLTPAQLRRAPADLIDKLTRGGPTDAQPIQS